MFVWIFMHAYQPGFCQRSRITRKDITRDLLWEFNLPQLWELVKPFTWCCCIWIRCARQAVKNRRWMWSKRSKAQLESAGMIWNLQDRLEPPGLSPPPRLQCQWPEEEVFTGAVAWVWGVTEKSVYYCKCCSFVEISSFSNDFKDPLFDFCALKFQNVNHQINKVHERKQCSYLS